MDPKHWIQYFILIFSSPGHRLHQVFLLSPTRGVAGSALSTTRLLQPSWRVCSPRPVSPLKGFLGILCAVAVPRSSMPVEEVSFKFSPQEIGSLIPGPNTFISLWSRGSNHRSWCPQVSPVMFKTTLFSSPFLLSPSSPITPQTTFWLLANVSTYSPY